MSTSRGAGQAPLCPLERRPSVLKSRVKSGVAWDGQAGSEHVSMSADPVDLGGVSGTRFRVCQAALGPRARCGVTGGPRTPGNAGAVALAAYSASSSAMSIANPSARAMLPVAEAMRAVPTIGAMAARTPLTSSSPMPISLAAPRFNR